MLCQKSPSNKCSVCQRPAFGNNYGSFSCDACKMFFRRSIILDLQFRCIRKNRCFDNLTEHSRLPHCKACRFTKCLETGMFIKPSALLKMSCRPEETLDTVIGQLLYLDSRRSSILMNKFSFENPGLEEIVKRKKMEIVAQTTLLQNFAARATLLFSSLRSARAKRDRLVTPGGQEIVPDFLSALFDVTKHFLCRIRSRLVNKLIELDIANEEFLLVTVILFCDPAISFLSPAATSILTLRRKSYTSALLQYCQLTHQQTSPTRFTDLLSLCHVVNKNIEDIQSLTIIVKFHLKTTECKKLYDDII